MMCIVLVSLSFSPSLAAINLLNKLIKNWQKRVMLTPNFLKSLKLCYNHSSRRDHALNN